jgi:FkbM family methyltransferase
MFIDRSTEPELAEVEVRGVALRFRCESSYERYRMATLSGKEPETISWIDRQLRPGDVFYDVGANIGIYSLYAAKKVPGARVHAFEPGAHSCASLLENVHLNGLSNVAVYCLPLGATRRLGFLNLTRLEAGSSMHGFDRDDVAAAFGEEVVAKQGSLSVPLDELLDEGLPGPDLLKIDVDGGEIDVLKGARRTLASRSVRSVLTEINWTEAPPAEALTLLRDAGFEQVHEGVVSRRGRMAWKNLIFEQRRPGTTQRPRGD